MKADLSMPMHEQQSGTLIPACPRFDPPLSQYHTLYVISHHRHLEQIPTGQNCLIVTTEWAALQIARERGLDAVHTDWARTFSPTDHSKLKDILLNTCEYIKENGADPTLYKGVSIGNMYTEFLSSTLLDIIRIDKALRHLCTTFSIRKIVAFDISTIFHLMGPKAKRTLIQQIGHDLNIPVEEAWTPPESNDEGFYHRSLAPSAPRQTMRDMVRSAMGHIVEWTFRIKLSNNSSPRVFLFISTLSLIKMVERKPAKITPVIPFEASPKSMKFLKTCWRNGILPAARGLSPPSKKQKKISATMLNAVESNWQKRPATGVEAVYRDVALETILKPHILAGFINRIDHLDRLIDRLDVRRIVSGDAAAPFGRALCQLAQKKGIGADETLNGVFASPIRNPIRMKIDGKSPPVSRELALGPVVKKWLSMSDSPVPSVVTGYPALGKLKAGALAIPQRRNALVLPIYAWLNDAGTWSSILSVELIKTIRELSSIGFETIRLKIHPGINNFAYYQWLVTHFDLPCSLVKTGDFNEHLQWADVVIGPQGSGTFLETIAAKKPYYILRPKPTIIPDELLKGALIGASAEEICSAICQDRVPDRDMILSQWCGLGMVDDPPSAIWTAIANGFKNTLDEME